MSAERINLAELRAASIHSGSPLAEGFANLQDAAAAGSWTIAAGDAQALLDAVVALVEAVEAAQDVLANCACYEEGTHTLVRLSDALDAFGAAAGAPAAEETRRP